VVAFLYACMSGGSVPRGLEGLWGGRDCTFVDVGEVGAEAAYGV